MRHQHHQPHAGRSARPMRVKAAVGSPKDVLVREIAMSNDPAGKGQICASACSKPCLAASRRASSNHPCGKVDAKR
jgi:hypothetical protein